MFVEQLEAVAHCILAQCKRARSDGPESIDDDTILKVLNDFSYEAIAISPEPGHGITQSLSPGWKDTIGAIVTLFKLFNLTATCPTTTAPTTAPTTTPTTTPAATAPTATTSTTTPGSNVSTATASTAVAPTTTTPTTTTPTTTTPTTTTPTTTTPTTTTPTTTTPTATTATTAPTVLPPKPKKTRSRKTKEIAVGEVISENLETWRNSPEKLFDRDFISLEGFLCDYIKKVANSDILNTLRLRFAKLLLSVQRKLWAHDAIGDFLQHLEDRGLVIDEYTIGRWILEGNTYELFVQRWGYGSLLTTDLTASKAEKFPHKDDDRRKSRLAAEESRGIKELAVKYEATGTALWEYFRQISFIDNFVSDDTTSLMTARKRRSSQTLTHQDRRPFRIDKTPAEFAQQPELISSPVTTQIGDVAEREAAHDAREGSRLEVENLQQSSPTAPARYQPVGEPSPRSASSSLDRDFTEDDCQRPLCGTDRSAYSDHRNDRIDVRQSPRTHQCVFGLQGDDHSRHPNLSPSHSEQLPEDPMHNASLISGTDVAASQVFSPSHSIDHQLSHGTRDVPQRPQVPGDVSSPTTHSVPTTVIQSRIAEPPASNPRSGPQSHVPIQEPSASPQHDRQLELRPTHQPKLPSPEPREEAKANDGGHGSAQQLSTQGLSPVQPLGLPISGAIETSCYPQHGSPPPHPPQTVPDPTVQRHGTGRSSSEPWNEPSQVTAEFQEHNPPEFLESQDSLQGQQASTVGSPPLVHQQPYQPEHPEVTGHLDHEPSLTPAMLDQPYDVDQEPGHATELNWDMLAWDSIMGLQDVNTGLLFSGLNEVEGI